MALESLSFWKGAPQQPFAMLLLLVACEINFYLCILLYFFLIPVCLPMFAPNSQYSLAVF